MNAIPPPDSQIQSLANFLPRRWQSYTFLARFDRPVGFWLLFWPCAWGLALAGGLPERWSLLGWFFVGAVAMRGAGCVYNDIIDRKLDAKIARTATRPVASGEISVRAALIWALVLCLGGLLTLLQLSTSARLVALSSLTFVAAYPFMKRITWWPQIWLGLVFSWGALVGWFAVKDAPSLALVWLYLGSVAWVIGYDTIYALQDIEDDALIGVKSAARALGKRVRLGVALCYGAALGGWSLALWTTRAEPFMLVFLIPVAVHLFEQVATLDCSNGADALAKFRSNHFVGLLVWVALLTIGSVV